VNNNRSSKGVVSPGLRLGYALWRLGGRFAHVTTSAAAQSLDDRVRAHVARGAIQDAATLSLRQLGPEVFGFLAGVLGNDADADEVFAATSERLWRSLATFEWRCSLRTWAYVIARREVDRFRRGARRHVDGRVPLSGLEEILAVARTSRTQRSAKLRTLLQLRDELTSDDRMLLVLRVDRELAWEEIALAFAENAEKCSEEERKREAARLRKRFQLLKKWLTQRAKSAGLLGE
jgi:RNA polymerase sigma-70 factor, ECF subfamily